MALLQHRSYAECRFLTGSNFLSLFFYGFLSTLKSDTWFGFLKIITFVRYFYNFMLVLLSKKYILCILNSWSLELMSLFGFGECCLTTSLSHFSCGKFLLFENIVCFLLEPLSYFSSLFATSFCLITLDMCPLVPYFLLTNFPFARSYLKC